MLNEQDDCARQRNYWERMKAKLMLAIKWLVTLEAVSVPAPKASSSVESQFPTPKISVNHIQQMPQREL